MTHLPFVAGAYGVTVVAFLFLSLSAAGRLRVARRRVLALESRRDRRRS